MPIYRRKFFPPFCFFSVKSAHLWSSVRASLNRISLCSRGICFSGESPRTLEELSSCNLSLVSKSIAYKFSRLFKIEEEGGSVELKHFLLRLSFLFPDVIRKFYRVSAIKPQDVLEVLSCFDSKMDRNENMVESLWGFFNWASNQNDGAFQHLPLSCKIMGSILSRCGFLMEAEALLSRNEIQGVLPDCGEIFSNLIEGYLREFDFDKAIAVYEKMRGIQLMPFLSASQALIEYSVELDESRMAYSVYKDMMIHFEMGRLLVAEKSIHEKVIRLLCLHGRVREARELVMKAMVEYGTRPSHSVTLSLTRCYCGKKDYDDLFGFFFEAKVSPDFIIGNRILFSVCQNLGVDQGDIYLQKLEDLRFSPDSISLGILIGFSCRESKLKRAMFYISEILSRGLEPHLYSYNALLSGIIKEGMWFHYREMLSEMYDSEITPNLSTFRIVLAGLCKARRFDEMKAIVIEMSERNLIELSPFDDPLSEGFLILGLDPLDVKIRRDNGKSLYKAEFFDSLGNGLYLDTNLDEFDRKVNLVIDAGMLPDFESDSMALCNGDGAAAVEEMAKWGQEMPLSALSSLFGRGIVNRYSGFISKSIYQLDDAALNALAQSYSREGLSFEARTLVDGMARRHCTVDSDTFAALFFDVCGRGDFRSFRYFWSLAEKRKWSPEARKVDGILSLMCQREWFEEAFELFGEAKFFDCHDFSNSICLLVKEISGKGFADIALSLVRELPSLATVSSLNEIYGSLLSGFVREKKLDEASGILNLMVSGNLSLPVDAVSRLVLHLCRNGDFDRAVGFRNEISRYRRYRSAGLHLNSALIKGFCRYGNVDEAAFLLRGKFATDGDVFDAVLLSYSRRNDSRKLEETLGFMIRNNLAVSASGYGSLARSICSRGELPPCLRLEKLMLRITDLPALVLRNVLVFWISETRDVFLLRAFLREDGNSLPRLDDVGYNYLIRGCLLCDDDPVQPLKYLGAMMKLGFEPSRRSLTGLMRRFCSDGGGLEFALRLSREMESKSRVHGSVLQIGIVEMLLENGMAREAVEFLDRTARLKSPVPKYDRLIERFCSHGRLDAAVDLLDAMLRNGTAPESASYDRIIRGFCRAGEVERALDLYAEMTCTDAKPTSGTTAGDVLVRVLCERGRVEEAEEMVESAIRAGEVPRREVFGYLMGEYGKSSPLLSGGCGRRREAMMRAMQETGYVPDFKLHWAVVSNMMGGGKMGAVNRGFVSGLINGEL